MQHTVKPVNIVLTVVSFFSTLLILFVYDGTEGYAWLPLMPFAFFIMTLFTGRMLSNCIPSNFGVTVFVLLLFIRSVLHPLFFALGDYSHVFRVPLNDHMPWAILLSVYEIVMVFIVMSVCDKGSNRKKRKLTNREKKTSYNLQAMRFWVYGLLLIFLLSFIIVPECKYFYLNISNITDIGFTGNEMSSVIDQFGTNFIKKFVMVSHNYLTKIVRFILPLHLVFEIHKKNQRSSGYWQCMILSALNVFIIDGTIARGLVYAFVLMLLTCEIFGRQKNIYKIAVVALTAVVTYFAIRATVVSRTEQDIWEYLSSYIGSYFSSVANTAANIRIELKVQEIFQYLSYDILESIPFGNTIFNLESISYQKLFNNVNSSAGQIPTTIGTGYTYLGPVFAPVISMIFAKLAYNSGLVVKYSKSVFKKGIYLLLAIYSAMAVTMYYHKIVLVVIIGALIPMLVINKLVEGRRKAEFHEKQEIYRPKG